MPRRRRRRHGLNAIKAAVKVRGLAVIDKRTVEARVLLAWRQELLDHVGGDAASPAQRALVEMAVRTRLYVDHVDHWLMAQRSLVLARRRSVMPIVRERQQLADSLARLLAQLGLERKAPKALSLDDIRAGYAAEPEPTAGPSQTPGGLPPTRNGGAEPTPPPAGPDGPASPAEPRANPENPEA
jgi:hypothetical protein